MGVKISFLGAAKNVTGSAYLIESDGARVLIDCGYYQERDFKHRNWDPFPVNPSTLDAVLLTHGHLDHCGLLPKIHKEGFRGKIVTTKATADIASIVMLDSAHIQEEDAKHKKRRHERKGTKSPHPIEPLFTQEEAEQCITLFETTKYNEKVSIVGDINASFHDAGHILGSSMVRVYAGDKTITFTGDVGRPNTPIIQDPSTLQDTDYLVIESTYGNRTHGPTGDIDGDLEKIINETFKAGGNLVIPSFAIERTQELLYRMSGLLAEKRIPHLTTFVDSPMAIRVTEVFNRHPELFDKEATQMIANGGHPCDFAGLTMSRTVEQSKSINNIRGTCVIIAGSGMCTGGRIKHHLVSNIGRQESTIMFVGYQAFGTLGRRILEGEEKIRILGEERTVKARIAKINGLSAHADQNELFELVGSLKQPPKKVFVTHGEPDAAEALAEHIAKDRGWNVMVPEYKDKVELND